MNTFELIEQTEKGCRGPLGISTPRSYRAAGIILMHVMRNQIINTGTVSHTECRMQWDHHGRFIQDQIQAQMVVEVDRGSGTMHFHRPVYNGTMKEEVFHQVAKKYGIEDELLRCSPAMRRAFVQILK